MLNLNKEKLYILACSFGPDSMALFDMLKKEGINFVVCHVNYGVREEAKEETNRLNEYCAEHDTEIEILYAKPLGKSNFEAKARQIRYEFFSEIYEKIHADGLLVAHNEDDNIETFYLQRKRGGFVEHFGIQKETQILGMNVIRPLLEIKKENLLKYCNENKVPYCIDSSNLLLDIQRNVIRHTIIKELSDLERKEKLEEIETKNHEIDDIYNRLQKLDLKSVKVLLKLNDEELQRAIVILGREIDKTKGFSASFVKEIKKVLLSKKPNITIKLSDDLFFHKEYDYVSFRCEEEDSSYAFVLEKPGKLDTNYFFLDFSKDSKNRNVNEDDYPITIRSPKPSDKIKIANYESEIRRLFIDWKMPYSLRKKWPVICSKDNIIIYVPRYRKDFKPNKDDNFIVKTKHLKAF